MPKVPTMELPADAAMAALVDEYADADRAAKAAREYADSVKDRLKLAMVEAVGADHNYDLSAVAVRSGQLSARLSVTHTWRLDTTRIKAEQPTLYAAYAKQSASFRLEVAAS